MRPNSVIVAGLLLSSALLAQNRPAPTPTPAPPSTHSSPPSSSSGGGFHSSSSSSPSSSGAGGFHSTPSGSPSSSTTGSFHSTPASAPSLGGSNGATGSAGGHNSNNSPGGSGGSRSSDSSAMGNRGGSHDSSAPASVSRHDNPPAPARPPDSRTMAAPSANPDLEHNRGRMALDGSNSSSSELKNKDKDPGAPPAARMPIAITNQPGGTVKAAENCDKEPCEPIKIHDPGGKVPIPGKVQNPGGTSGDGSAASAKCKDHACPACPQGQIADKNGVCVATTATPGTCLPPRVWKGSVCVMAPKAPVSATECSMFSTRAATLAAELRSLKSEIQSACSTNSSSHECISAKQRHSMKLLEYQALLTEAPTECHIFMPSYASLM
jgi:hypothetical protein